MLDKTLQVKPRLKSHKTLKVRAGTFKKVEELADQSGQSLGAMADTLLSGAVKDFREVVEELAKVPPPEQRFNIGSGKPVVAKVTAKVTQGAGKGASEGAKGAALGAEKIASGAKEIATGAIEGALYGCEKCHQPVEKGLDYCTNCGAKLDWSKVDLAEEDRGSGAVLLGLVVFALVAYNHWRQRQEGGQALLWR